MITSDTETIITTLSLVKRLALLQYIWDVQISDEGLLIMPGLMGAQIFQKSSSHLKILVARRVI
jgi:hypothetical protein